MAKVIAVVAGIALAVLAVVGTLIFVVQANSSLDPPQTSSPVLASQSLTVHGTMLVRGYNMQNFKLDDNWGCVTTVGYDDIRQGAQVVITDASGVTIAVGNLSAGSWRLSDDRGGCVFPFEVTNVPLGHRFYGVEVSHRGRTQHTAAQLTGPLELEIGG